MTFTEIVAGMIILGLFLSGFAQAALPALRAWDRAQATYRGARATAFVAESFTRECGASDRNIERWKQAVQVVKELEGYEISEEWQGETLRALRLRCVVSGEALEVLGLWTP
jgi:hypothetical protein